MLSHAIPAGSLEVTVVFTFVSGCTVFGSGDEINNVQYTAFVICYARACMNTMNTLLVVVIFNWVCFF
jgi:hypothetical protein